MEKRERLRERERKREKERRYLQNGSHLKIRYRLYNSCREDKHHLPEIVLEKNVRSCKPHTHKREIDSHNSFHLVTLIKIFEVCEVVLSLFQPYKVFLEISGSYNEKLGQTSCCIYRRI